MKVSPINELRVRKDNPAEPDGGWTETYYQVVRGGEIRIYAGHHKDGLRDVTSTFEKGWGVGFFWGGHMDYRQLRPDEAQEINNKIQALEKQVQEAQSAIQSSAE